MRQGAGVRTLRLLGAVLGASLLAAAAPAPAPLYGFTPLTSGPQRALESRFLDLPSAQSALDMAAVIGSEPHYDGTPRDHELALWARDRLAESGFDARIETFVTRVDRPLRLALEVFPDGRVYIPRTGTRRARGLPPAGLDLREAPDPNDPQAGDPSAGLPFNAGAADGDVVAPLVYANRGTAADFATLAKAGVDVRGAVVLIRYGAAFRGELAEHAQDAGAVGVVFYSDPADGYAPRIVQRGSVGTRVHIPTLPVSPENARTLLHALKGGGGPAGWGGGLEAAYPVGRGPALVHLVVKLERKQTTLWNTIGVLHGSGHEQIMLGAHRDAWVYGVGDNGAGTITVLEAARALGFLAKSGWVPRRSIVAALWDAEEIGEYGSLAYADAHANELRATLVAYLNADENVIGPRMAAAASGSLAPLLLDVVRRVPDPAREHAYLDERWRAQPRGAVIGEPSGGSDHESFMNRFATPVLDFGFASAGRFVPYHSSYDTLHYARTRSDPGFVLHRVAAQIYGMLALRAAAADAMPYTFSAYLPALRGGLTELQARAERDRRVFDAAPITAAIRAFAVAARRHDDRTAHGSGGADGGSALAAAQAVDGVAYGTEGYQGIAFPALQAAYDRGGDALRAATDHVRDELLRATALLQ